MKGKSIRQGLIAVCAAGAFLISSCAQAQIGMTEGRARANIAAAVGLISAIAGATALIRSAGRTGIAAVVLGLIAIVLSVVHLATFTGGFGTGGGRAGAMVALVLGLLGISLGGFAVARSRRYPA